MIDIEIEDEAGIAALPDAEAVVQRAAQAVLSPLSLDGRGVGGEGARAGDEVRSSDRRYPSSGPASRAILRKASANTPIPGLSTIEGEGGLTVLLTDDATVRDLNARFRSKDGPTNVLSFPSLENPEGFLGDVALAFGVCAREAEAQSKPLDHHLSHLVAHGVLHLLGYDHQDDAEAATMEGLERDILARLGIPDPYGERPLP